MPNRLYSLTYLSRLQQPETRAALRASLMDIFEVSRRNNRELGITGALLVSAAGFAQVLEGGNAAIQKVFGAIRRDPRHRDVTLLSEQAISERSFSEWSMVCVQAADDKVDGLEIDGTGAVMLQRVGTTLEAQRIVASLRAQMTALVGPGRLAELPEELSGL